MKEKQKTKRLHSLDSLRAIMMLLGIVLHSAVTYGKVNYGEAWELKDPISTDIFFDWLVQWIHKFRMPIFYIVSGFFGSLLFYERSALKMIKNRINRILYPFIVSIIVIIPTVVFGITFSKQRFSGISEPFSIAWYSILEVDSYLPFRTYHLWFLYYLILFTIITFVLGLLFKRLPKTSTTIRELFRWTTSMTVFRILVLSSITFVILSSMGRPWVATSFSLVPDFGTLCFYFFFYIFGWLLFQYKSVLTSFIKYDLFLIFLGTLLFTIKFFRGNLFSLEMVMVINSVTVWLLCFGITGLFLRFGSQYSSTMRYISDSSYWVYLAHFSLTVFLPGLIASWTVPAFFKFLIVVLSSSIICMLSYHYLVRNSFVGEFLNGKRYHRRVNNLENPKKLKTKGTR